MEVLTKSEMEELLYIADGTLGRKNTCPRCKAFGLEIKESKFAGEKYSFICPNCHITGTLEK